MPSIKKIIKYLTNSDYRFLINSRKGKYNSMPDDEYLKRKFKAFLGRELNLENPQTFNEKLQWMKIHDRNPLYNTLVDKYEAKKYVAEKLGEEYVIPTLGLWESADDIDFDSLPDQFVMKCTHDSKGVLVCKDKSKLDVEAAREKFRAALKRNYFYIGREWPYKDLKPRVIAEKYMTDSTDSDVFTDYKFFCFNGVADNVMIVTDRDINEPKFYHFSKDWNILRYNRRGRRMPADFKLPKPENIDEMFRVAEKLAEGLPHVRMDLYVSNGQIYFGEFTLYHNDGLEDGFDEASDLHLGSLLKLPEKRA